MLNHLNTSEITNTCVEPNNNYPNEIKNKFLTNDFEIFLSELKSLYNISADRRNFNDIIKLLQTVNLNLQNDNGYTVLMLMCKINNTNTHIINIKWSRFKFTK